MGKIALFGYMSVLLERVASFSRMLPAREFNMGRIAILSSQLASTNEKI